MVTVLPVQAVQAVPILPPTPMPAAQPAVLRLAAAVPVREAAPEQEEQAGLV